MKNSINIWIPPQPVIDELQKLIKFVEFVGNLEYSTAEDKQKIKEIIYQIENIHKANLLKVWNVCLDIYDFDVMGEEGKEGFYWRTWSVFRESNFLTVEAKSKHTADQFDHYGDGFYLYGIIYFDKDVQKEHRVCLKGDLDEFVKDAMNYKNYITESLNKIELDIDICEKRYPQ